MSNKFWFKPKNYGYGFYPISWEGWLSVLALPALIFLSAYANDFFSDQVTNKQGARYLLDIILITSVASLIFVKKTEGKLQWNWGKSKKNKK